MEKKASVAVQCDDDVIVTTVPSKARLNVPRDSKRKRDSTSSEDLSAHEVTTVATVHSQRQPEAKRRRRLSSSSDSSTKRRRESTSIVISNATNTTLKRKRQRSTSSERSLVITPLKTSMKSLKARKPGPLNGKQSARESSPIVKCIKLSSEVRREDTIAKYLQPKSKKMKKDPREEGIPKLTTQLDVSIILSSDDSDFVSNKRRDKSSSTNVPLKEAKRKIEPSIVVVESVSNKQINNKNKISQKTVAKSSPHQIVKMNTNTNRNYQEAPKELVIEERDVEILRLFLQKHYRDEDLLRFDTSDEYKKMHFYQINPLVNVERCPQIDRMTRAHSQGSQLSLLDFANKLGLKSIDDVSEPKRYRTRRRDNKTSIVDDATDSSDKDKENVNRPAQVRNGVTKVLKGTHNKDSNRDRARDKKGTDKMMEMLELSSDESERRMNNVQKPPVKKVKPKATISTKR